MFYGRQYMLMEVIVQCLDDANSLVHVRPWREIDELDMKGVSQYSHRYKRLNRQNTSKKNSSQEKKGNIWDCTDQTILKKVTWIRPGFLDDATVPS